MHDADDHEVWLDDEFDDPEIVHWYESRPLTVGAAQASAAVAAAFALGALTAVGVLALLGRIRD